MQPPGPDQMPMSSATTIAVERLRSTRVLLAGLGNIGSYLGALLAPLVLFIRLVDRDIVEEHNSINQFYGPQHVGQTKVDVTADRIAQMNPQLAVERRVMDLEDLPWEDTADVDIAFAGLDSLIARQLLFQKLWATETPYIDGAVGDPLFVRVQVLLPGKACLECSWGPEQYRQLATEYPCHPAASSTAPPTTAPGCAGAATAAVMVAQCMNLLGDCPPPQSYEINGELLAGRFRSNWRRRNERCRFHHEPAPQLIPLKATFADATIADVVAVATEQFAGEALQFEFRRGLLKGDLFAVDRLAAVEQLRRVGHCRLTDFGLTARDRVVVRSAARAEAAHVCFQPAAGSLK